jgi:hypothetical protein
MYVARKRKDQLARINYYVLQQNSDEKNIANNMGNFREILHFYFLHFGHFLGVKLCINIMWRVIRHGKCPILQII